MKQRTITAFFMLIVLLPLVVIDHIIAEWGFFIVAILFSTFATYEIINMMYKSSPALKIYRYLVPAFSGIITALACLATKNGTGSIDLLNEYFIYHFYVLISFLGFSAIILGLMIFTPNSSTKDIFGCLAALTYAGLIFGYVLSIRYLEPININKGIIDLNGVKSFIYVYSIVVSTDMFAYFIGIKWGKHKLCPNISPKKSVEGAVAGFIAGSLVGTVVLFVANIVNPLATNDIILAVVGAIAFSSFLSINVQIGDLIASKIKRGYNIKDFSNFFPGHGGVLDRFDSLLYSGIWFYIIIQCVELIIIGV
ncbi:MAG: phosphatidate cytidylyltransferase [Bacilli bacterium]|nr:phosphatidate cytidylyltransferase [Bacilli bacterium]